MTIKFRKENLPEFSGESLSGPSGNSPSGSGHNGLPGTSCNACSDHSSTSLSGIPFISERSDADTTPRPSICLACAKDARAIGQIQAQALEEVLGVASSVGVSVLADQWEQSLLAPAPGGYQVLVALHTSMLVGSTLAVSADPLGLDGGEEIPAGMLIAELLIEHDFTRSGHASRLLAVTVELPKAENLHAWACPEDEARMKFLHSAGSAPAGIHRTLEEPDGSLLMEHLWWTVVGEQSCIWEMGPKTEQSTRGRDAICILCVMSHILNQLFGSPATAMVTSFIENGALDVDSAMRLTAKFVGDDCDTILLSGTAGESPTTHQLEKNELTATVKEAAEDHAFISCSAGSSDTAHVVRVTGDAQAHGVDGLSVVSPYYNRPPQVGLIARVYAVVEASGLLIMLYDIPGHTGLAFSDETLDVPAQYPRVRAVKDATDNVEQGMEQVYRTGLEYYPGDDDLDLVWMTGGASGFISVIGHVAAKRYRKMIGLLDKDKVWEAREFSYSLRPLIVAIMGGRQGAVMTKHVLHLQGVIDTLKLRLPLVEAEAEEIKGLRLTLKTAGLL